MDDLNEGPGSRIHGRMQAEDNVVELSPEPEAPLAPLSFEELFLDVHDRLSERRIVVAALESAAAHRRIPRLDPDPESQLRASLAPHMRQLIEPLLRSERETDRPELVIVDGD
jgi:hypothetical protein